MLDKKRGYAYYRPFYAVDANVNIMAGMVAFLATNAVGVTVATTAASGTVPIGSFWKDRSSGFVRTFVESTTFGATTNILTLLKGNVSATGAIKVQNAAGTVTYTQGTDYAVTLVNGVVTRIGTGAIAAGATVLVTYSYNVTVGQEHWDNVSTQWSSGVNYDRQADDTLGSSRITIAEGDAKVYTDQYDTQANYALNNPLYSDAASLWTSNAAAAVTSICGRVISVPTASDPFLGLDQIRVGA